MSKRESPSPLSSSNEKKQKTSHDPPAAAKDDAEFFSVQEKLKKIDEEQIEEIVKIRKKFIQMKQPLFEERAKAISKINNFWKITVKENFK